jgi:Ca-activated chloride channel family protein
MILVPVLPGWAIALLGVLLGGFALWQLIARRSTPRTAGMWASRLVMVLLLVVIALRPTIPTDGQGPTASGGLEVYFVVDTTSSMAAEDWNGDQPRLDGVKDDIVAIVDALPGAQFSLVTFDVVAVQRVPLTADDTAIVSAASVLRQEITSYSRGSSIDEPIAMMAELLTQADELNPDQRRVLFYLGDGEQTAEVEPQRFDVLGPFLEGGGVLGYGTAEGGRMPEFFGVDPHQFGEPTAEPLPEEDPFYIQDPAGGDALSRIDEVALETIATDLGVGYVHRDAGASVDPVLTGIEVGELVSEGGEPDTITELYWIFAIPLGLLALLEIVNISGAVAELLPGRRRR